MEHLIEKYKELSKKGYGYYKIAKELNMPVTTTKRYMKKLGIKTINSPYDHVEIPLDKLKELINQNKSTYQIAKMLSSSQTNIRYWLKKYNLKTIAMSEGTYKVSKSQFNFQNEKNNYTKNKNRGIERKLFFIKQLGGKCSNCGYNRNYSALTFHHKNPNEKESGLDLRKMSGYSFNKLQIEVNKCQLLCHNCHMELHYPNNKMVGLDRLELSTKALTMQA